MTRLAWDAIGEHLYETGVDHAVLYPIQDDRTYSLGVAWNGITSISENPSGADETKLFADNIKYLSLRALEEYGCTVEAFTYPDEWAVCDGSAEPVDGVNIGQQTRKVFGLCYRTLIGNDTEGNDHGYKLHLVYGGTAAPSQKQFQTVNDSPEAITFSWEITTTPVEVAGFKPTSHIEIDSTRFKTTAQKALLTALETILYGSDGTAVYTEFTGSAFAEGTVYYERTGTDPNYIYTPTSDTSYNSQKTYYTKSVSGAADPRLPMPDEVLTTLGYVVPNE